MLHLIKYVDSISLLVSKSYIFFVIYSKKNSYEIYEYFLYLTCIHTFLSAATSLIQEVIKYASGLDTCRAVYLHVIAYNEPAILFYKKMSFRCLRRLQDFYYIRGRHYDSFLFVYYVNGGRSPCSPL